MFAEYIKDTNERCLEKSMDLQMQLVDSFNKLIILLPRNCKYDTIPIIHPYNTTITILIELKSKKKKVSLRPMNST